MDTNCNKRRRIEVHGYEMQAVYVIGVPKTVPEPDPAAMQAEDPR